MDFFPEKARKIKGFPTFHNISKHTLSQGTIYCYVNPKKYLKILKKNCKILEFTYFSKKIPSNIILKETT